MYIAHKTTNCIMGIEVIHCFVDYSGEINHAARKQFTRCNYPAVSIQQDHYSQVFVDQATLISLILSSHNGR